MALKLHNTLSKSLEPFVPREPGRVSVYVCGPTVYDVPHVGHARAAVVFDVLVRHLRAAGWAVTYVRNVTDIDDKVLARARSIGEPPLELAHRMERTYQEQMRAVGCLAPEHEPRVSEHLSEVIALISKLLERGAAYLLEMPGGTRDVYFSVRSFPEYGKLSHRRLDDLKVGARVAKDEHKRDPADFALWKGAAPEEWGWDSPWGRGRPGWHIECSAMSTRYLGYGFDIHGGGMDLIFPHHENEIAQSEAAHPDRGPCVRYWLHNGFVNLSQPDSAEAAEKMSKSLGNYITVGDVLSRNDPEAFRWFLLTVHYRGPLQFELSSAAGDRVAFPGIDEAEARMDYLYSALRRVRELASITVLAPAPATLPRELVDIRQEMEQARQAAQQGLDEDLNTPVALASLGELARLANEIADQAERQRKNLGYLSAAQITAGEVHRYLNELCAELGLAACTETEYFARTRQRRLTLRGLSAESVETKLEARRQARSSKEYARADALRTELAELGIVLRDTPAGTEWTVDP